MVWQTISYFGQFSLSEGIFTSSPTRWMSNFSDVLRSQKQSINVDDDTASQPTVILVLSSSLLWRLSTSPRHRYLTKIMTATVFVNRTAGQLEGLFAEKCNSLTHLCIALYFLFYWYFWVCVVFIWFWAHTESFHSGYHEINAEAFQDHFCH